MLTGKANDKCIFIFTSISSKCEWALGAKFKFMPATEKSRQLG